LHLSVERTRLIMRVQRELYNTPHEVAVFPAPVLLDQVNALPYYGQVVGSYVDSPGETGFAVQTDLYPVYVGDLAGDLNIAPPTGWDYIPVVVVQDLGTDGAGSTTVSPPTEWSYIPTVVTRDSEDFAGSLAVFAPTGWSYIPVVVVYEDDQGAMAVVTLAPPLEWSYAMQVVPYDGGTDSAGELTITPPTNWAYQLE